MKKSNKHLIQLPEKQTGILPFLIPFIISSIICLSLPNFLFTSTNPILDMFETILHAILAVVFMWVMLLIEAPLLRSRNKGKFILTKKGDSNHE